MVRAYNTISVYVMLKNIRWRNVHYPLPPSSAIYCVRLYFKYVISDFDQFNGVDNHLRKLRGTQAARFYMCIPL